MLQLCANLRCLPWLETWKGAELAPGHNPCSFIRQRGDEMVIYAFGLLDWLCAISRSHVLSLEAARSRCCAILRCLPPVETQIDAELVPGHTTCSFIDRMGARQGLMVWLVRLAVCYPDP